MNAARNKGIVWRGLTLLCCFLIGMALAVAAFFRFPPSNYRGYIPTRGRYTKPNPPEPIQSDFKPIQNSEQLVGLLEYVGSAGVLWFGCVVWWTRRQKEYDQYTMVYLMILILSAILAVIMTIISINALIGAHPSP